MSKVQANRPAAKPSSSTADFQKFEKQLIGDIDKELKSILNKFQSGFDALTKNKGTDSVGGSTKPTSKKATKAKKPAKQAKSGKAKKPRHTKPAHKKQTHKTGSASLKGAGPIPGGQVGNWIKQALTILQQHGIPASKMNAKDIATIIKFESGGNPRAQNNWDSNARAGHPSIGLMQTIGPTFNSYKLKGHNNIRNPVDNIIAGVRYAISRYGSISNVPGIKAVHAGGHYVGY